MVIQLIRLREVAIQVIIPIYILTSSHRVYYFPDDILFSGLCEGGSSPENHPAAFEPIVNSRVVAC